MSLTICLFISSEKEWLVMRKRINWIFSIVLTVLLLSLMPTRAEAGAAVTINSVVAAAENVMPALGKTAAVDGTDITITSPADLPVRVDPDRSGRSRFQAVSIPSLNAHSPHLTRT